MIINLFAVALILCNLRPLYGCNFERTDSYVVNVGDDLEIPSGCSPKDAGSVEWLFVQIVNHTPQEPKEVVEAKYISKGNLKILSVPKERNGTFYIKKASEPLEQASAIPVTVKCACLIEASFFKSSITMSKLLSMSFRDSGRNQNFTVQTW